MTLSELRVELMYPANDAADRFFRNTTDRHDIPEPAAPGVVQ